MKFTSRKDILFQLIGFIIIGFFIGIILYRIFSDGIENYNFMWTDIFMLAVAGFLIWLGLGTNYELTQTELKYKSGPISGKIEIDKIHEIIKGKTLWSGLKPATARNGLIIKYEKYNEIYISPKTNESFVKKILELNEKIKITTE
ncbi:PH domain-containing protein [Winogradskyella bathintestinalis]|uniref:PH domain-containing protein n=1 Tax=Winogradskyella bathintestinalis TaxID=3035208 RepID=A0ABT7ZYY8_9FLAO|nr:PH domain-containing protein [Winogradskyella bathintestinalis]MDN3494212.1 PH domain-containing protein [Winogradskyella bathintestinalis]